MSHYPLSRRRFLMQAAVTGTTLPLLANMVCQPTQAALPLLAPDNPQAKAFNYVDDASNTKHSAFKPGSACANCQFFTATDGACAIFSGFSVASAGWCSAWAKKA